MAELNFDEIKLPSGIPPISAAENPPIFIKIDDSCQKVPFHLRKKFYEMEDEGPIVFQQPGPELSSGKPLVKNDSRRKNHSSGSNVNYDPFGALKALEEGSSSVIKAEPQIRNIKSEVKIFAPSSLKHSKKRKLVALDDSVNVSDRSNKSTNQESVQDDNVKLSPFDQPKPQETAKSTTLNHSSNDNFKIEANKSSGTSGLNYLNYYSSDDD